MSATDWIFPKVNCSCSQDRSMILLSMTVEICQKLVLSQGWTSVVFTYINLRQKNSLLKGRNLILKIDSVTYTDILLRHSMSSCLFLHHPIPSSEMCFALVLGFLPFPCFHISAEADGD